MSYTSSLTFREADLRASVPARFQQVLAQTPPDRLAYVSVEERLTYQELAAASWQFAAVLVALLDRGTSRSTQKAVALLLPPQGAEALIGMIGVLAAGHFYVPLDFVMGEAMLRDILLECSPQAIVTTTTLHDRLTSILPVGQNPPVLCLDALAPNPAQFSIAPPADDQMLACIQYTSGSTGRPRGVMRTHAAHLYASYLACHDLAFMPGAHIAHLRSYAYGASQQPVFGGILNGATVYSLPAVELTPAMLYHWIDEQAITHLYVTLGLLRGLADLSEARPPLTSLRVIMTGGEPLYRSDVERLYRLLSPTCKIVARLVSTETSVYARFVIQADTTCPGDAVPGGYAAPGTQVMILDEHRQPLPAGEVGEIAVRSRFLAAGYWQRPEDTAARFLPDPHGGEERIFLTGDMGRMSADGCLEMVGRKDFMVKIRGYRVELQAIEAALLAHPGVCDGVVVAQTSRSGELRLIAYIVPRKTPGPPVTELRQALGQKLPQYMIPARFVFVDQLARKVNSKIDQATLPPPGPARPDLNTPFIVPRTEMEQQIADIWAELLELDEVGVEDDFFALGGDSILAMRMALAVEQMTGGSMPPAFFRMPTVAHLVGLLRQSTDAPMVVPAPQGVHPAQRPRRSVRRRLRTQVTEIGPLWRGYGVPYGLGIRLQRLLVAQPFMRHRYAKQLAVVERWAEELGLEGTREQRATISLLANTWLEWRTCTIAHPANRGNWWTVNDLHHVLVGTSRSAAGIVLAVPHVGRTGVIPLDICRRSGCETGSVVGGYSVEPKVRSEMLLHAERILQRGGVVMVAADGLQGNQAVEVPFWGRRRPFQIGAAELAVTTGAVFVPVYIRFDVQGHVGIEIAAPLIPQATSPQARIRELTERYGADYAARWPQFYASVLWRHLEYNLRLPVA